MNSLLSLYTFDVSVNGSLPHGDTLCMLSYEPSTEPQSDAKDDQDDAKNDQEEEARRRRKSCQVPAGGTTSGPSGTTSSSRLEVLPLAPAVLPPAPGIPARGTTARSTGRSTASSKMLSDVPNGTTPVLA